MHVPVERAQELLHQNGEVDPRLVALEVELYQRKAQNPAMYVGYLKSGHTPIVETFTDAQEGEKYVTGLKETKDAENPIEFFVIKGAKA